jgi:hypothetical protein
MASAQKRAQRIMWIATHKWKPELLEDFAHAMRRHARHRFPNASDALRRAAIVITKGNVAWSLKVVTMGTPEAERRSENWKETTLRSLYRLKKKLFLADT